MPLDDLPTLSDLIPRIRGDVVTYAGDTWVVPESIEDANSVPDHGIVRCGFRLYEILEWSSWRRAWKVAPFKATLNALDLRALANGNGDGPD